MGLRSLLLLGLHFFKHVLSKLTFRYDRGGSKRFVRNYVPDRLLPLEAETRGALPRWQACIGCGLCDAAYGDASVSVMSIVVSAARDFSTLADASADAARLVDAARLAEAEVACPMGVPITDVVSYVAAAPARLENSGAPGDAR